ncbi:hypothetical protein IW136_005249, partial [Coemansia sp. RSA 678]
LHPFLRELSFSAFDILKLEGDRMAEHRPLLSARGLSVILRELHAAVASKLVRRTEKRVPWGKPPPLFGALATFSSNIANSSARHVFSRVQVLFPSLLQYLDACLHVRARFRNDVDELEQLSHAPRVVAVDSLSDVSVVELCIDRLLHIVSIVLSWDGLQADSDHTTGPSSLTLVLGALARQGHRTHADEIPSIVPSVLVRRAFDYLHSVAQTVATSIRAIDVLRMLVAVRSFAPSCEPVDEIMGMTKEQRNATMDGRISEMARCVLDAKWGAVQDLRPADLELLVGLHVIRCPHNRLDLAYTYAAHILPQSIQDTRSGVDDSMALATLKPATFASAYKAVSQALATIIQDSQLANMGSSDMVQFSGRVVDTWVELTRITQTLSTSLQRTVLVVALRSGLTMTDLFTKTILPILDSCFFTHRDNIIAVLERMRKATRILQSICNHSKASQDTKLQSAVPQTKRKLEQLIFQVYVLMGNNDSMGAVTLGRLKHRGVRGEVVSSQIPRGYESEEESEEEAEEDVEGEEAEGEEEVEDVRMESASDDN